MTSSLSEVVDDDDHVRNSTIALLGAFGIDSRGHASGAAFLKDFDASTGCCILLDLHMPGLSDFQILDNLRERGSRLPVVLFSGRTDLITEQLAEQSGAVALLPKPVVPAQLIGLVRRLLAENRAGWRVPDRAAVSRPVSKPRREPSTSE
jgi:two-component system, LuxR family, response regulator FixJ